MKAVRNSISLKLAAVFVVFAAALCMGSNVVKFSVSPAIAEEEPMTPPDNTMTPPENQVAPEDMAS